jgi:ABC-type glycerol-3-phosphate transport system substrate-binding protein
LIPILVTSVGRDFVDGLMDGSESWTDPDVVEVWSKLAQLMPYMHPQITEFDDFLTSATWAKGEAAMEVIGPWRGGLLMDAGLTADVDFGWFPFPPITSEFATMGTSGADVFVASSQTDHPEEVKQYLSFWGTIEAQETFSEGLGTLSPAKLPVDFYEYEYLTDMASWITTRTALLNQIDLELSNLDVANAFLDLCAEFQADPTKYEEICQKLDALAWGS